MKILQPPGWPAPRGYSNGMSARGRLIFTAGIVGWGDNGNFVARDLAGQLRQALLNILAILKEDGAGPEHVVRMTWYLADREEYLDHVKQVGAAWREVMGKHFPCLAVVQVAALIDAEARIEIEAMAVVPE